MSVLTPDSAPLPGQCKFGLPHSQALRASERWQTRRAPARQHGPTTAQVRPARPCPTPRTPGGGSPGRQSVCMPGKTETVGLQTEPRFSPAHAVFLISIILCVLGSFSYLRTAHSRHRFPVQLRGTCSRPRCGTCRARLHRLLGLRCIPLQLSQGTRLFTYRAQPTLCCYKKLDTQLRKSNSAISHSTSCRKGKKIF